MTGADAGGVGPVGHGSAPEHGLGGTEAPRYRRWEQELVAAHLGRSVLEVGSGMGHFSARLASMSLERLVLSDTEPGCLERLRARYAGRPGVEVVELGLPGQVALGEPVETVVAMNVLEHIGDHRQALEDLAAVVVPGGRIVLWVPAYPALYGEFDRLVGHVRRYTPATMRAVVEEAGLRVTHLRPVNLLGGAAWWVAVRRGGAGQPDRRLVWAYDQVLIPVTRLLERVIRPPFGQSLLCVAAVDG